jgi:DNA-binding Xre family transcriptional regulator
MYKNLEYLLKTKKMKASELVKELGITDSAFSQFRNRKSTLSKETLLKLAKILNCTIEEILDEEELVVKNIISVKNYTNILDNFFVDCGKFNLFIDDEKNYVVTSVDKEIMKSISIMNSLEKIISFVYKYDSMTPTIQDRDLVYVDLNYNNMLDDGIYLINEDSTLKIRRIKKENPTKPTITIKSDNKDDVDYKEYNLLPEVLRKIVYGRVIYYARNVF